VIVRHLVIPGFLDQSRKVLWWFARQLRGRALLSLMFQYTPVRLAGVTADSHPKRTIRTREYDRVLSWLEELGIDDGYVQDPATGDDWLPDFTRLNPFPRGQAVPIWHYDTGYVP
jgi:putative pyruvate formate lyase activating enzyme